MKVLWLINGILPQFGNKIGNIDCREIGWITSILDRISNIPNVDIIVVCPQSKEDKVYICNAGNVRFYGFYQGQKDSWVCNEYVTKQFYDILCRENPDIIQIWGTEYAHSLDGYKAAEMLGMEERVVVHMQGLVSVIAEQYCANLPNKICRRYTFRDFIRHSNILTEKKRFWSRGKNEIDLMSRCKFTIGRTDWDYAHSKSINRELEYFYCNESVRDVFFQKEWNSHSCEKHSIFVTQGNYPVKGFHFLIEAVSILVKRVPDTKVYVAGERIIKEKKDVIRESSYARYVKDLIKHNNLRNHFVFLGYQNKEQMAERYQKANVFVLPSAIENSPNSLAEALVIGTPCVASTVGGITSMVEHEKDCMMYQYNDATMMAYYIEKLFSDLELCVSLSEKAKEKARINYSAKNNCKRMLEIYQEMISMRKKD